MALAFVLRYPPSDPPLAAIAASSIAAIYKKSLPRDRKTMPFSLKSIADAKSTGSRLDSATRNGPRISFTGNSIIARVVGRYSDSQNFSSIYGGSDPALGSEIEAVIQFAAKLANPETLAANLKILNAHLEHRSVMCGQRLSLGDCFVWEALLRSTKFASLAKGNGIPHLNRWWSFINGDPQFMQARKAHEKMAGSSKSGKKKQQGSFDIELIGAKMGKVVTRFPPEPSGFLHIGHAKAVLLNDYFAKHWKGKCILRFDDTNPEKEKQEFVDNIMSDLKTLDIKHTPPSTTSEHFESILKYADKMIADGKAYVDDTAVELLREQRMAGIESESRSLSIEEHHRRWAEMKKGTEFGLQCVLRAKIDMQSLNKCLRDPVMYRCKLMRHHKTGDKYKVYPTYDFACPIVDSNEGVTHALRTVEYKDRDAQYNWFITAMGLRRPHIWSYSRLNMRYTVLSKRKLKWFVETNRVEGWDDPRFPTVQGVMRRGLTIEALREFILNLGASTNDNLMSWDKIWNINKKKIDPVAHRYIAINKTNHCVMNLGAPVDGKKLPCHLHPKNKALGTKELAIGQRILFEADDALLLKEGGEEVTLVHWGNCIIKNVKKEEGKALSAEGTLNLSGNFKTTNHKLTWLASDEGNAGLVEVLAVDFGQLITKPKLEDGDNFEDFLTPVTRFETKLLGEPALKNVKKGQIIQLERRGFFRCDVPFSSNGSPMVFFNIPTGKEKGMGSRKAKTK